ncbi:hypothetical protein D3C85_502020 [compost metagenome]
MPNFISAKLIFSTSRKGSSRNSTSHANGGTTARVRPDGSQSRGEKRIMTPAPSRYPHPS